MLSQAPRPALSDAGPQPGRPAAPDTPPAPEAADTRRLGALRPSGDPLSPVVLVESGAPLGLVAALTARPLTLGRAPGLGLVLDDPAVSRVHAGLSFRRGRIEVQDFGSRNGTFVGGRRVAFAEVEDGALVRIGETLLRVFLRARARASLEHARLHLGLWRLGLDPDTRLPHGGALRGRLVRACREARQRGEDVHLTLAEADVTRRFAEGLRTLLPAGAEGFRHGSRRVAVLSVAPLPSLPGVLTALGAGAWGQASSREVDHDPDRLLLAASARLGARPPEEEAAPDALEIEAGPARAGRALA